MRIKHILSSVLLCFATLVHADEFIRVSTKSTDIVFRVSGNGRLYQSYFGRHLTDEADLRHLSRGTEAYLTHGMEDYFEPALDIRHADGNPSTLLTYVSHNQNTAADGSKYTVISLQDKEYGTKVNLHFNAYTEEDVIKTYTEITNGEKKPVILEKYASSMLHLTGGKYWLTEFSGNWADEGHISTTPLNFGKKVLDTKLGTRANMFTPPMFILSVGNQATEDNGQVILGQLGWTGNFRFTFEVDEKDNLRLISGINPYFSSYQLGAKETFTTPEFYFTMSYEGMTRASHNLHNWARKYQLKDGQKGRMTLLNNWEATYFDFNEEKLCNLMGDAVKLGVDMFLLDDGWFGNKHPRHNDTQGLGDWQETADKLPGKVTRLVEEAQKKGIKFGIWIEPEMVNPKSELYEKHKDWVIHLPNRDEYYFRNQMVLDLSNPKVQDFVFGVVDRLMTDYPGIAYFKWDCNSPITNIYSHYLKDKQTHLYVDYVHGLYNVLERIKAKYPNLPMMLCSGGSGRIDYKALSYFTEFWASDNTDPLERLFIQYAYSYFYPVKATCAHVTTWNSGTSIKFRTDVTMMGKMGFDIKLSDMSDNDLAYCKEAVKNYRRLSPVIMDGNMYRLYSPYEGPHAVTQFVGTDQKSSVVFAFNTYPRWGERNNPVLLKGLNPDTRYRVREINMWPGANSSLGCNDRIYSGQYLMNIGLNLLNTRKLTSYVLEITAE
ncbi:MAG: alpha-galactosidase [Bacteroidaceae bacterium]|nr:alpha-galactosidase [Bacteroidaceae bacterium]